MPFFTCITKMKQFFNYVVLVNYSEYSQSRMHSEKEQLFLIPILRYDANTHTTPIPTPNTFSTPILFNTNTTNETILQYLDTYRCRYRQYQYQTIPTPPIPERVGVGTCLISSSKIMQML